jgi:non-specific protein-tyrosine kinase
LGLVLENRAGRIGSMVQFEQETGWSVLAQVPVVRNGPMNLPVLGERLGRRKGSRVSKALVALHEPSSAGGESYAMLRTRLELLGVGTKYHSLLVTSSGPRDGKSSVLSNLAATFGAAGHSTVVVDAELRRPTIHTIFGVYGSPGLTDVLDARGGNANSRRSAEQAEASRLAPVPSAPAMSKGKVLQETLVRGVAVLAGGTQTREHPGEISWAEMPDVLENLKSEYEIVLVDSAPPLLVHDTLLLCGMVDAVVVVVDARSYDPERLMEMKLFLERSKANVLGAVLNKIDPSSRYAYGYSRDRHRDAS